MEASRDDETLDAILGGSLRIVQPRSGYRFSVEALLLARFARVRPRERVLELGAGCGVIALMLAALHRPREVVALELQPRLAALIARNAVLNSLDQVRVVCGDLRRRRIAGIEPASFDLVVANPPFHAVGAGRESPQRGRRLARGEHAAALDDFIAAARRCVRNGGRVAFVHSAGRTAELVSTMRARGLEPKRLRLVHPRIDRAATVVLLEARAQGGIELAVEPPLILYERPGVYTAEARAMLESRE
jgi:tRNA1(Val) A37 N6-methylase TrmN6